MRTLGLIAAAAALAGCVQDPGDALAPPGVARGEAVDPVIVGDRLSAAGEHELALESYILAAGRDGMTPALRRTIAATNMRLGRLGQAERMLRELVAEDARDAAAWNDLGVVLLERGVNGEAHEAFRRAFALDPSLEEAQANLALTTARLDAARDVAPAPDETFTLSRRNDGVYTLARPR